MNSIRTLVASVIGSESSHKQSLRPDVRRVPACESLEGRQLLSASGVSTGASQGDAASATGTTAQAQVESWNGVKDVGGHYFHRSGAAFFVKGAPGHSLPALSPQAKADLQALRADINQLKAEVPAALQAQINADKATIRTALSSLTPEQRYTAFTASSTNQATPQDRINILTNELKAAGVSDATTSQITKDFQTYAQTLKTILSSDSTLSAQIQTDQAALMKDLPAPAGHSSPMLGAPGHSMGPGFGF